MKATTGACLTCLIFIAIGEMVYSVDNTGRTLNYPGFAGLALCIAILGFIILVGEVDDAS